MADIQHHHTQPIVLLRLRMKPGVRNSQRVVHMAPLPEDSIEQPTHLTAWCGQNLAIADVEPLPQLMGMPCELCLSHAPTPESTRLGPAIARHGKSALETGHWIVRTGPDEVVPGGLNPHIPS